MPELETMVSPVEQISKKVKKEVLARKEKEPVNVTVGSAIDVGKVREHNEDSLFSPKDSEKVPIFAVADGMGGEEAGEVASDVAIAQIRRYEDSILKGREIGATHSRAEILIRLIQEANYKIHNLPVAKEAGKKGQMVGTTEVAVMLERDEAGEKKATFAWAGDSLGFVYTPGARYHKRYYDLQGEYRPLSQVTQPHSLVESLRASGQITTKQMESHPQSNVIYRPLGEKPSIEVDTAEVSVKVGDVILLCSDGIQSAGISHDRLENALSLVSRGIKTPQEMSDLLIQEANNLGGPDNITVVIVKVEQEEDEKEEKLQQLEQAQENLKTAEQIHHDLLFALQTRNPELIKSSPLVTKRTPQEQKAIIKRLKSGETIEAIVEEARIAEVVVDLQVKAAELPILMAKLTSSDMLKKSRGEIEQMILAASAQVEAYEQVVVSRPDAQPELEKARSELEQWVVAKSVYEDRLALQRLARHLEENAVNYREFTMLLNRYRPVLETVRAYAPGSEEANLLQNLDRTNAELYGSPQRLPGDSRQIVNTRRKLVGEYLSKKYYDVGSQTEVINTLHVARLLFPHFLIGHKSELGIGDLEPAEIRLLAESIDFANTGIINEYVPRQMLVDHLVGLESRLKQSADVQTLAQVTAAKIQAERELESRVAQAVKWDVLKERIEKTRKTKVEKVISDARRRIKEVLSQFFTS